MSSVETVSRYIIYMYILRYCQRDVCISLSPMHVCMMYRPIGTCIHDYELYSMMVNLLIHVCISELSYTLFSFLGNFSGRKG